jgi:hypothetical protein
MTIRSNKEQSIDQLHCTFYYVVQNDDEDIHTIL